MACRRVTVLMAVALTMPTLLYGCEVQPVDYDVVEKLVASALRSALNVPLGSSRILALQFCGVSIRFSVASRMLSFIDSFLRSPFPFVARAIRAELGRSMTAAESSCVDYASMSWRAYAMRVLAPLLALGKNAASPIGVAASSVSACLLLLQRAAAVESGMSSLHATLAARKP